MNIIQNIPGLLRRYFPILAWGAEYSGRTFANDLIVAGIVTVMLIPQSLAYALLAGLPAQVASQGTREYLGATIALAAILIGMIWEAVRKGVMYRLTSGCHAVNQVHPGGRAWLLRNRHHRRSGEGQHKKRRNDYG